MIVKVKNGQSIFDISLQYTGDCANIVAILAANNKENTDVVEGESLKIPADIVNKHFVKNFGENTTIACKISQKEVAFLRRAAATSDAEQSMSPSSIK